MAKKKKPVHLLRRGYNFIVVCGYQIDVGVEKVARRRDRTTCKNCMRTKAFRKIND